MIKKELSSVTILKYTPQGVLIKINEQQFIATINFEELPKEGSSFLAIIQYNGNKIIVTPTSGKEQLNNITINIIS